MVGILFLFETIYDGYGQREVDSNHEAKTLDDVHDPKQYIHKSAFFKGHRFHSYSYFI